MAEYLEILLLTVSLFTGCLSMGHSGHSMPSSPKEMMMMMAKKEMDMPPPPKTMLITPDNVRYYASFIDSSSTINDLFIHFGTGPNGKELLCVPIAAPGALDKHTLIRITISINPPAGDNDPVVGITDGTNRNQFYLIEHGSTGTRNVNPCEVHNGQHNGRTGPVGNTVAGEYTLLFDPSRQFGSCATNNGFSTDARFNKKIDLRKRLSLVVHRDQNSEEYFFHYFLVEFL